MSAVAGIFQRNSEPVSAVEADALMKSLERFPSDDASVWQAGSVFLGHHAQWITPDSVFDRMPRNDYARQLSITADAILDNRDELFHALQIEPSRRAATADSELIMLAYEKWGDRMPYHLIGDFAFMIWDGRKKQLFGARDFSGSRTLYFHRSPERFAFCTVMKPLLGLTGIDSALSESWIAEFLAHPGMIDTVDARTTVYRSIEQLPPSHTIKVTAEKIEISEYSINLIDESWKGKSSREYVEAFRDVFGQAVAARVRTHRKVGAFLSGGLDSGAVASFAARELAGQNKRLHTYSYVPANGFVDWTGGHLAADERPFIQSTVRHVGNIADHYLSFDGASPLSEVDDWLEALEMPYKFFENSFWLKGIYEMASQHEVGLLLNGARGNFTVSFGPALDYYALLLKRLRWTTLLREMRQYGSNKGIGRRAILSAVSRKAFPVLDRFGAQAGKEPFPALIHPEFAKRTDVLSKLTDHGVNLSGVSLTSLNLYEHRSHMFRQNFAWNLNGTMGTKLSLRYGLWNRDPTNDIRVIRFCLSVPEAQYVQNGLDRALIRRATESYLPDEVRLNQRVRGIQGADGIHRMAPMWPAFVEELQTMCNDPDIAGFLNIPVIQDALTHFRETPRPRDAYNMKLKVLMRSLIFYRFIKKYA